MEVLSILLVLGALFVGGVVFTLWGEVQNVDKLVWQSNAELKNKIRHLEDEVIGLNKTIKELKESAEEQPEEKNVSS